MFDNGSVLSEIGSPAVDRASDGKDRETTAGYRVSSGVAVLNLVSDSGRYTGIDTLDLAEKYYYRWYRWGYFNSSSKQYRNCYATKLTHRVRFALGQIQPIWLDQRCIHINLICQQEDETLDGKFRLPLVNTPALSAGVMRAALIASGLNLSLESYDLSDSLFWVIDQASEKVGVEYTNIKLRKD